MFTLPCHAVYKLGSMRNKYILTRNCINIWHLSVAVCTLYSDTRESFYCEFPYSLRLQLNSGILFTDFKIWGFSKAENFCCGFLGCDTMCSLMYMSHSFRKLGEVVSSQSGFWFFCCCRNHLRRKWAAWFQYF